MAVNRATITDRDDPEQQITAAACKQLGLAPSSANTDQLVAVGPPRAHQPTAAPRLAVCLTGQPRSFSVTYTQWVVGGFLSYLRTSFGEIDWFVVASHGASYDASQHLIESLHPVASIVTNFTFAHDGDAVTESHSHTHEEGRVHNVRFNVKELAQKACHWYAPLCQAPTSDDHARRPCDHRLGQCLDPGVANEYHPASKLQLYQLGKCADLIRQHEKHTGATYAHVARLRFDVAMLRWPTHGPAHIEGALASASSNHPWHAGWLSTGTDYAYLGSRDVVVDGLFAAFERIVDGHPTRWSPAADGAPERGEEGEDEEREEHESREVSQSHWLQDQLFDIDTFGGVWNLAHALAPLRERTHVVAAPFRPELLRMTHSSSGDVVYGLRTLHPSDDLGPNWQANVLQCIGARYEVRGAHSTNSNVQWGFGDGAGTGKGGARSYAELNKDGFNRQRS